MLLTNRSKAADKGDTGGVDELQNLLLFEVAELLITFQSSRFFTIVLAVLIHLSDVVLQLADFSCDL